MLGIQQIALERAINTLKGLGAQYKIILQDGTEYGDLHVKPADKPRTRAISLHPWGALKDHYMPYVKDMEPGGAGKIPFGVFEPDNLRGSLAAWCNKHWGAGASITSIDRGNKVIEIIRLN
jgi:hypothetical protein